MVDFVNYAMQYKDISLPIIVVDSDLRCVFFNPACVRFPEIKMMEGFIDTSMPGEVVAKIRQAIAEGQMLTLPMELGNQRREFQVTVRPLVNGHAELMFVLVPTKQEKQDPGHHYAAGCQHLLSHELFNLMNAVHMLRRNDAASWEKQQDIIWRNTLRAMRTTTHMLMLEKADEGEYMVFDIIPYIRQIAEQSRKCMEGVSATKIRLLLQEGPISVHGDPAKLRYAVLNLISNALRFSPEGSTIYLRVVSTGDNVEIAVENEPLQQEFPNLLKASRSVSGATGAGLGMKLAQKIVAAHQGQILSYMTAEKRLSVSIILPKAQCEPVLHEMVRTMIDDDYSVTEMELSDLPMC